MKSLDNVMVNGIAQSIVLKLEDLGDAQKENKLKASYIMSMLKVQILIK